MLTQDRETLHLQAGRYLRPVTFTRDGSKWRVKFPYNKRLVAEIKALDGARWNPDGKYWTIRDSARNRFALRLLQGEDLPWYHTPRPITDVERPLYTHQREMAAHILAKRRFLLIGEQGVGKTVAAIEAMERSGVSDWLIVGPRSALRAWRREVERWGLDIEPQFSTYESLYKLLASWKGAPPQGVIFDESSRIKNPSANRSRAARKLSEALEEHYRGEEFVVCMTGTPAPNTPADWWHQAETVRSGWLRESSRRKLEQRIAIFESLELPTGPVRKIIGWDPEEVELLGRRLEGLAHTWLKRDCLDLPEKVYETWREKPSQEMKEAAQLLTAGCTTAIETLTSLRQLSDGFVGEEHVPSPKDRMLEDLLEEYHERGRVIVFAAFHRSIDRVLELCRLAEWDAVQYDGRAVRIHRADGSVDLSTDPVEFFQAGSGRVAWVGHPKASGMGLTLTASEVIAYWSNDFDAESRAQSEDRIHRPGCRGAKIIDFVHLPSDDLVRKKLKVKQDLQSITVEEIRKALQ